MANRGVQGAVPPFCVKCGYNLTGAISNRCPECGYHFSAKEWRDRARQILRVASNLKQANQWAHRGVWIGLGGVGLVLLQLITTGVCVELVLTLPAIIVGLATVCLGLGVFRVPSLPPWTSEGIAPPRDYTSAGLCVVLGTAVVAGAIFAP